MPIGQQNFDLRSMTFAEIDALEDPNILFEHIKEGTWNGMPNFLCPCCPHAWLNDRTEIEEHLQQFHIAPVMEARAQRKAGVGLFDARGQLITPEND